MCVKVVRQPIRNLHVGVYPPRGSDQAARERVFLAW